MAEKRPKKKRKTISRNLFNDSDRGRSVSFHSDGSEKAAEEIKEILANVIPPEEYPLNPSLNVIRGNDNTYFTPISEVILGGKRKTRRKSVEEKGEEKQDVKSVKEKQKREENNNLNK